MYVSTTLYDFKVRNSSYIERSRLFDTLHFMYVWVCNGVCCGRLGAGLYLARGEVVQTYLKNKFNQVSL